MNRLAQQLVTGLNYTRDQLLAAHLWRKGIRSEAQFLAWAKEQEVHLSDPVRLNIGYAIVDIVKGKIFPELMPTLGFKRVQREKEGKGAQKKRR